MTEKLVSKVAMGVCGAMGALADAKVPNTVLKPLIHAYSLGFGVNRTESDTPPDGFQCFGDFFARPLKPGSRPVCPDSDAAVSPCDGRIAAIQPIEKGQGDTFRVKGFDYSITQLIGEDCQNRFAGGIGMVIYLHPRDYHRVHSPVNASLLSVRHIPGARFPVAPWAEKRVSGIFQRNERMVFHFDISGKALALVMVSAFGVGNIDTPYAPPKGDHTSAVRMFNSPVKLSRAEEIGAFRLGSTVVLLWESELLSLSPSTDLGKILLGEKLGTLVDTGTFA